MSPSIGDDERAEVLHAEFPEAFGHQVFPPDLFDLLDLLGLQRSRASDDREVDAAVALSSCRRCPGGIPPLPIIARTPYCWIRPG